LLFDDGQEGILFPHHVRRDELLEPDQALHPLTGSVEILLGLSSRFSAMSRRGIQSHKVWQGDGISSAQALDAIEVSCSFLHPWVV
jgi:hypothetical protein